MWQLILSPIIGLFGGFLTKWMDLKAEKQKADERAAERSHELLVMDKEYLLAEKKMKVESDLKVEELDAAALGESYKMFTDKMVPDGTKFTRKQISWALVIDGFNRIIRPISTIYYQLLVAVLFSWSAWELHVRGVDALTTAQFGVLVTEIIFSIIGMAQTTLFWWFGTRPKKKEATI